MLNLMCVTECVVKRPFDCGRRRCGKILEFRLVSPEIFVKRLCKIYITRKHVATTIQIIINSPF